MYDRILKSNSMIVLCDWDRGTGKSYTEAELIKNKININSITNFILIGFSLPCGTVCKVLEENLKKVFDENYEVKRLVYNEIIITHIPTNTRVARILISCNSENIRGEKCDYIICDEYLPSSKELNYRLAFTDFKQIYIFGTFGIDYIQ